VCFSKSSGTLVIAAWGLPCCRAYITSSGLAERGSLVCRGSRLSAVTPKPHGMFILTRIVDSQLGNDIRSAIHYTHPVGYQRCLNVGKCYFLDSFGFGRKQELTRIEF
jgi:hypothetical protein